jgi:hypothetical protein
VSSSSLLLLLYTTSATGERGGGERTALYVYTHTRNLKHNTHTPYGLVLTAVSIPLIHYTQTSANTVYILVVNNVYTQRHKKHLHYIIIRRGCAFVCVRDVETELSLCADYV